MTGRFPGPVSLGPGRAVSHPEPVHCDPCGDERWRRLADGTGHLFTSTAWLRVLRDGYGLRPRAVIDDAGGFAWVEIDDLRGMRIRSLPFTDFAGPVGTVDIERLAEFLEPRFDVVDEVGVRLRSSDLDPDPDLAGWSATVGLQPVGELAWHWTELVVDVDAPAIGSDPGLGDGDTAEASDPLWRALASGARQNVRRSRRHGVAVETRVDREALGEYQWLHRRLRRSKYRLLAQPDAFFDALHQQFAPDDLAVVLARLEGRVVAGVVLLRHRDWAYYKLNASLPEGWSSRANDAVMWAALGQARRWGCRRFCHGVSDRDQPGLIRYKDKYASGRGKVVVLSRRNREPGLAGRAAARALPMATRAFTHPRCPEPLTAAAGNTLYRYFC